MWWEPADLQGRSASLWVGCDWEGGQRPQVAKRQVVPGGHRLDSSKTDLLTSSSRLGGLFFNGHLCSTSKQSEKLQWRDHSSEELHGVSHFLSHHMDFRVNWIC